MELHDSSEEAGCKEAPERDGAYPQRSSSLTAASLRKIVIKLFIRTDWFFCSSRDASDISYALSASNAKYTAEVL